MVTNAHIQEEYDMEVMHHSKYIVACLPNFSALSPEIRELLAILLYIDRVNGTTPEARNQIAEISRYCFLSSYVRDLVLLFLKNKRIPAILLAQLKWFL